MAGGDIGLLGAKLGQFARSYSRCLRNFDPCLDRCMEGGESYEDVKGDLEWLDPILDYWPGGELALQNCAWDQTHHNHHHHPQNHQSYHQGGRHYEGDRGSPFVNMADGRFVEAELADLAEYHRSTESSEQVKSAI